MRSIDGTTPEDSAVDKRVVCVMSKHDDRFVFNTAVCKFLFHQLQFGLKFSRFFLIVLVFITRMCTKASAMSAVCEINSYRLGSLDLL